MNLTKYLDKMNHARRVAPDLASLAVCKKQIKKDIVKNINDELKLYSVYIELSRTADGHSLCTMTVKYHSSHSADMKSAMLEVCEHDVDTYSATDITDFETNYDSIVNYWKSMDSAEAAQKEISTWKSLPKALRKRMATYLAIYFGSGIDFSNVEHILGYKYNIDVHVSAPIGDDNHP